MWISQNFHLALTSIPGAGGFWSSHNWCRSCGLFKIQTVSPNISVNFESQEQFCQILAMYETVRWCGNLSVWTTRRIESLGPSSWERLAHSCTIFPCYLGMDNQCRDPMNNNKDCRVGRLTTSVGRYFYSVGYDCNRSLTHLDFSIRFGRIQKLTWKLR